PEQLSNPEFGSLQKSLEVEIGQNVTLSCQSTNGSLPINYTFFRGSQNLWPIIPKKDRNPALFNLTISSASDVGEYKCKVENRISNSSKYSKSLNFTLLDPVSKPVLSTTTSQVRIGQNVTLSCHSENGSSPINYIFFKGKKSMSSRISMQGKAAAVLNVTINSPTDLGDYKCKAENNIPNNTKYSNSLTFTLAGMCLSYLLLIASDDELLMISSVLLTTATPLLQTVIERLGFHFNRKISTWNILPHLILLSTDTLSPIDRRGWRFLSPLHFSCAAVSAGGDSNCPTGSISDPALV
uniref:Mast cell immunoglobulin like receptor 1 n=1 Tax=Terrapene triunguis TaxID=2587831 RepID=A0A674IHR3_9SAUR